MASRTTSSSPVINSSSAPIQPRKEPVQDRSKARFARILEVSNELIIEKGVDAVSMKDVAQGAEISIASLYQYFPDKAAIIATLADRYNREGEDCVENVIAEVNKPSDLEPALIAILDAYYEFFCEVPGSYAIWQASQADVRLHQLDDNHCDAVTQSIAKGLIVALPCLTKKESLTQGRIFTLLIAAIVRKAANLSPDEAKALLDSYKQTHLIPALKVLAKG